MKKHRRNPGRGIDLIASDISSNYGKMPPQAPDMEEAVIGALLVERDALISVVEFMKPEYFYVEAHRVIYEAVIDLFKTSRPVDMRTVVDQMRKNGTIELLGENGVFMIAELTSRVSSAANIEYHARIIIEMWIRRTMIKSSMDAQHLSYDTTTDTWEIVDKVQSMFDEIQDKTLSGKFVSTGEIYNETLALIVERLSMNGVVGLPSGLTALDKLTNGFMKTELTIMASRPGMGKTATVVCILRNMAIDLDIPVGVFELEMAKEELMFRLMSAESGIPLEKIRGGKMTLEEATRMEDLTRALRTCKLYIDDTPTLSVMELRAKAKRLKAQKGVKCIVVDYLQLMSEPDADTREQEISSISRGLKILAKELKIPIIALAQLSRDVEKRGGNKRPMLSDLRESGSIEQDADIVMFLFRPEYYGQKSYDDGSSTQGVLEIIIAKHRNGAIGTAKVKFISWLTKVTNFEIQVQGAQQKEVPPPTTNDLPF